MNGRFASFALLLLPVVAPAELATARPATPILHEPISPDPAEDLALHVELDSDLPAALQTTVGIVSAPDPRKLPSPSDAVYGPSTDHDVFVPDRETGRPDVGTYDEPFTPSTAPFKRLEAFDGVSSDYKLYVHDPRLTQVPTGASSGPSDDAFYANLVVDAQSGRNVRIPSVGAGARIVHARLGIGVDEIPMRVMRDGADNWFLQAYGPQKAVRGRLVMEVLAPRAGLGGQLRDPGWGDLQAVAPLPDNVAREATVVRAALHVSRRMQPRQAIARLVQYFREFTDSDEPPRGRGSVYLDLALSKKGVCRHRSFAFLVTALSLGVPTRLVMNEAHAWVEVHDGTLWHRIDLGGAGRITAEASEAMSSVMPYEPPPDAFTWPQNAHRGGDMAASARGRGPPPTPASSNSIASGGSAVDEGVPADGVGDPLRAGGGVPSGSASVPSSSAIPGATYGHDNRPVSSISIVAPAAEARRGEPLRISGMVRADEEPCPQLPVELWLRAAGRQKSFLLGTLATGDDGAFSGAIVVPVEATLGDYDIIARTPGTMRCGAGSSE
ncbi:MAG: transglutaminase domain-containing protein [Polyangiaceae bacterium]